MDIGANNYPFQCFLCSVMLKLHPSFLLTTVNHKSCTLSHNFLHNRKIYLIRKLLTKFHSKTRFYTQTLVKSSWHSNVSHTESQLHFITQFEEPQRATRSMKAVHSFLILISINMPHQNFFSISHNVNTQKFIIKKIFQKYLLSFSSD